MDKDNSTEILDPAAKLSEVMEETQIRPRRLSEFTGQSGIIEQLTIFIAAAKKRGESLDHTIFSGHPG
jgi:Holliday junction DNA helicase RuvB